VAGLVAGLRYGNGSARSPNIHFLNNRSKPLVISPVVDQKLTPGLQKPA
jgi:hypothetical protein